VYKCNILLKLVPKCDYCLLLIKHIVVSVILPQMAFAKRSQSLDGIYKLLVFPAGSSKLHQNRTEQVFGTRILPHEIFTAAKTAKFCMRVSSRQLHALRDPRFIFNSV
jgi:hypothetical protein